MEEKIKEICYDLETGCIDWVEASKQLLALCNDKQQRELLDKMQYLHSISKKEII